MKRIVVVLSLLCIILIDIQAQISAFELPDSLTEYASRVDSFALKYPQEKVFLHLDNTCYFLGDTIYYKAYTRRTDTNTPSNISNVLYVELLNHDGYLMTRNITRITNGEGTGSFVLRADSTMFSGFYEIRAYTRWQLNFGITEREHMKSSEYWFYDKEMAREFFRDYEKLYSRVVPVYDHPLSPGDYTRDMTLRRMMRYFALNEENPKIEISFYPEGGQLVEGIPCRVAYEAVTDEGQMLEGELSVDGQKVPAIHRGRAAFIITPRSGEGMEAVFTAKDGSTRKVRLPAPQKQGVSLQVQPGEQSARISVRMQGASLPGTMAMTVKHQGRTHYYAKLEKGKENQADISYADLPTGVCQVTVYDATGRVWADRLFFARGKEDMQPTLRISGQQETCQPLQQVSLKLQGLTPDAAGGRISLAVQDAVASDVIYDNGNIQTEMLLASEIRGFIPNPSWYFQKNDEEHRAALDLLMMTQGWRRFVWKDMVQKEPFQPRYAAEKHITLQGGVYKYEAQEKQEEAWTDTGLVRVKELSGDVGHRGSGYGHPKDSVQVHLEFVKGTTGITSDVLTGNGRFLSDMPIFKDACMMHLAASKKLKKIRQGEHQWIEPNEWAYPEYYVRVSWPYPRFTQPYSYYQTQQAAESQVVERMNDAPGGISEDNVHQMQQISVRAKRGRLISRVYVSPAVKVDAYEAFNAVVDAGLIDGMMLTSTQLFTAVARGWIGDMGVGRAYKIRGITNHSGWFAQSSFNDPNYSTISVKTEPGASNPLKETKDYNFLENLDSVYIFTDYSPRLQGAKRYKQTNQPTVTVQLKRLPDDGKRVTFRDRFIKVPGYSLPVEFYNPDYSKRQLPQGEKDYRRTLYWNPAVQLDEKGEATVTFYNNSGKTRLSVSANGQTAKGTLLTGEAH